MNRSERVNMFFMWGKLFDRNALCCYFTEKNVAFKKCDWNGFLLSTEKSHRFLSINISLTLGHLDTKCRSINRTTAADTYLSPLLKEKPKKYFCLIWDINLKYTRETISPLKQKIWSFIFLSFQKRGFGGYGNILSLQGPPILHYEPETMHYL